MNSRRTRILAHLHWLRESRPKHFWGSAAVAGASLFGMVAAFAVAPTTAQIQASQQIVVEALALPRLEPVTAEVSGAEALYIREERVQRGDSIASLLARMGVDDQEASEFLRRDKATRPLFQQLRPGKWITTRTDADGKLFALVFPLSTEDRALVVERKGDAFTAGEQKLELETRVSMKSGEIRSSLFAAIDDAGIPDNVAVQLTEIFGSEIDFHRELRRGDRFSVVFETIYHHGQPLRAGRVLAAEFVNGGKNHRAVYYASGESRGAYYSPEGKSLKAAFLRSPLEVSRISSGFAMRRHPIMQDWRAHKGVDYAAPTGTRVKATSDGVVDFVGRQNGYGNIIVLRHRGKYTTHYGHLNGFAPGMRKGGRVAQGEVIGYVGMTGWATGPHLHYEFRIDNVHQNPLSAALPVEIPLEAGALAEFRRHSEPLMARIELVRSTQVALLD
jgi:murein DD-endopeptidase MepM/ murein hydrolase activator NlpD